MKPEEFAVGDVVRWTNGEEYTIEGVHALGDMRVAYGRKPDGTNGTFKEGLNMEQTLLVRKGGDANNRVEQGCSISEVTSGGAAHPEAGPKKTPCAECHAELGLEQRTHIDDTGAFYCRPCAHRLTVDALLDHRPAPEARHPADWDPDDALYEVTG